MPCALAYRAAGDGGRPCCNVCQQPSTIEPLLPPEPELVCVVCCESWGPRTMFVPGNCGHVLCVGCTTQVARDAHNDRTRVTADGLPCGFSGCGTRLARDVVRTLLNVGGRTLPDARATHGNPPEPIQPLTEQEVTDIERFMEEETVPVADRAWCPDLKCGRLINLPRTTAPSEVTCIWCDVAICAMCAGPWQGHDGGRDCAGAKSAVSGDKASMAFIDATAKKCPNCSFPTSHFLGHGCHHISPDTNGCMRCHTHYCYSCLATGADNAATRGVKQKCRCGERYPAINSWSWFCFSSDTAAHLKLEPYPHDTRCGCPVCPYCRVGAPCEQCQGDCPVCKGAVAPGPMELAPAGALAAAAAAAGVAPGVAALVPLRPYLCVAPNGVAWRRSPQFDDRDESFPGPFLDDIVEAERVETAGDPLGAAGSAGGDGGRVWLKLTVRGLPGNTGYVPWTNAAGEELFEAWGGGSLAVGDPVRVLKVPEDEARRRLDGFGGWAGGMASELGSVATVNDLMAATPGRIRLRHARATWIWATTMVVRVRPGSAAAAEAAGAGAAGGFRAGETVRVRSMTVAEAEGVQRGHGGWCSDMARMLGTTGTITSVDADGDVRLFGKCWSPAMVERVGGGGGAAAAAAAAAVRSGVEVTFRIGNSAADWAGCPGSRLSFSAGDVHTVHEVSGSFFTNTRFKTLWAPISATTALVASGAPLTGPSGLVAGETSLVFKKTSGYAYPPACVDGEAVTYLQTNGGSPPAQVRWASGHTYWVEWRDLLRAPAVAAAAAAAAAASLPGSCAARRSPQKGSHACQHCAGKYTMCFGAYGVRDASGTWSQKASDDLSVWPESPNDRFCCAACEALGPAASSSGGGGVSTGAHGGEWRGASKSQWCSLESSQDGPVCAHGDNIITAPHWSCCGVRGEGSSCTVRS